MSNENSVWIDKGTMSVRVPVQATGPWVFLPTLTGVFSLLRVRYCRSGIMVLAYVSRDPRFSPVLRAACEAFVHGNYARSYGKRRSAARRLFARAYAERPRQTTRHALIAATTFGEIAS